MPPSPDVVHRAVTAPVPASMQALDLTIMGRPILQPSRTSITERK
jgi:hypothetical protein